MITIKRTFQLVSLTIIFSSITGGYVFAGLDSSENIFTLSPEFSMNSGDYGGGDTIRTYSMSVTGSYDFSPKWAVSLTVVPYLHQNETYTDVVLINGQPVHHIDTSGGNPHHVDTQIQAPMFQHPGDHVPNHSAPGIQMPSSPHPGIQQPNTPNPGHYIPDPSVPGIKVSNFHNSGNHIQNSTNSQSQVATTAQTATSTQSATSTQTTSLRGTSQVTAGEVVEQKVRRHGSASGIGDAFVNLSYQLFEENNSQPGVSLHTGVKLPTADEDKGLGTGELDYQMGVGLGKGIGNWFLYGGLDYNILGDPDYSDLDNYISGYASASTEISDNIEVSVQLSAAQAATDVSDYSVDFGLGMNYFLDKYGTVSTTVQKGLTDGSPDYAFVVGYSYSF